MSACFENMLGLARKLASVDTQPNAPGIRLLSYLQDHEVWTKARALYYTDEKSLQIFDWVQQYRALGSLYSELPSVELDNQPYTPEEWKRLEQEAEAMTSGFVEGDYLLDRINTWLLESYALHGECEAEPGDTVLDCGSFTGNTSLYFSQKVGESGHVYGFEASQSSYEQYCRNMRNSSNVTPVQAAVLDVSGQVCFAGGDSPAARVSAEGDFVSAISLDDFCVSASLPKVDFIKMDVEGAEAQALEGARRIIKQFKPKMAISAYHKQADLIALPARILAIAPGYRFALRHYSNEEFETVLFCIPPKYQHTMHTVLGVCAPDVTVSPEKYKEVLEILFPKILAGMKKYNGDIGGQFTALFQAITQAEALSAELTAVNKRLTLENSALRKVLETMKNVSDSHAA